MSEARCSCVANCSNRSMTSGICGDSGCAARLRPGKVTIPTFLAIRIARDIDNLADLSFAAVHSLAKNFVTIAPMEHSNGPISLGLLTSHLVAV
jgi:hypothetical protein